MTSNDGRAAEDFFTVPQTPDLIGGPVDTFESQVDHEGITLTQITQTSTTARGARVRLTPDDAYGLFHTLWTELRTMTFPEMIIREANEADIDGMTGAEIGEVVMECPRCGAVTVAGRDADAAVDVIDIDLRRTGGFFDGDLKNPELHVNYDSETNYEGLLTECAWCNNPVGIPENVTEQA